MKSFKSQFCECKEQGLNGKGRFLSFEKHPEMLPFCPKKQKLMLERGVKGIHLLACKKFGGTCSSGNKKCKAERNKL